MIYLYNTLTRKKEEFKPIEKGKVKIYCCGPTVYDFAHIGNLRKYICDDLLKRMFLYNNYSVTHVVNITDVGHLASDADEGEDKLMKAIKREKLSVSPESMLLIAKKYTEAFKKDINALNILDADHWPKATENIEEIIDVIKKIEAAGATYKTGTAVMFDVSKFPSYADLGKLNLEAQKEGAREEVVKDPEKRNPQDFALWFFGKPNHVMQWDSPWGKGFPGWHIECTAMSSKILSEHFDIHTGGIDHIPVHHTNEIAQSETAFGHKWVNYWVHNEFLTVNKDKMAKSAGTFITLKDVTDKGYDPLAYRYFCLTAHYRSHLNFSWDAMDSAKNSYENMKNRVLELKENPSETETTNGYADEFKKAINDDVNIPVALSVAWAVLKDSELGNTEKLKLILDFDKVLGLKLDDVKREDLPKDLMKLVKEREDARKNKDWKKSDELRDLLKEKGVIIEDAADGTKWKRVL